MTVNEQLVLSKALEHLRKVGSVGMLYKDVIALCKLDGATSAEAEATWELMETRKYIAAHYEPVTCVTRWALTERGATALAGL